MIASFVLFFNIFAAAEPSWVAIADGNYEKYKTETFAELQKETSVHKKHEILKALYNYRRNLYDLKDFVAKVVPYNNGTCLKSLRKTNLCGTSGQLHFFLTDQEHSQTFTVRLRDHTVLNYTTRSRSKLKDPHIFFGKAIHLISDVKLPGVTYLLIREIEAPMENTQPVRETVNVFRMTEKDACRVVDVNTSGVDGSYERTVEYVRAFSSRITCEQPVFLL